MQMTSNTTQNSKIENENQWQCCICFESNNYPVIFKCNEQFKCTEQQSMSNHSESCCYKCAQKIDKCPICRANITTRQFDESLGKSLGLSVIPDESELKPNIPVVQVNDRSNRQAQALEQVRLDILGILSLISQDSNQEPAQTRNNSQRSYRNNYDYIQINNHINYDNLINIRHDYY